MGIVLGELGIITTSYPSVLFPFPFVRLPGVPLGRIPVAMQEDSLSPGVAYYIRKLFRQNVDRLQSIDLPSMPATLSSLDDMSALLHRLHPSGTELAQALQDLEKLVLLHQALTKGGRNSSPELQQVEGQMFQCLGYEAQSNRRTGKVLLTDDDAVGASPLVAYLTKQGYEVTLVRSGQEAIDSLTDRLPDVLLLDVVMPGMDGFSVCEFFKGNEMTRDIPVILLSSIDDAARRIKGFGVGAADFIVKPYDLEEVALRINYQWQIRQLQQRLEKQNVRLQEEIRDRTQAEVLYREMFDRAVDGIFQSSPEGRYLRVNQALAILYGYKSPEDLIASVWDIKEQIYTYPERRALLNQDLMRYGYLSGVESEIYRRDGSRIWISESVRLVKDSAGKVLYYEGSVRPLAGMDI
jgi:adenylate cyclase